MGKIAEIIDVSGCKSVTAVLDASHTNWDIEVLPATGAQDYSGGGYRALVRPDSRTALAFVSERYRTNSHRQQLMSLDSLVASGDIVPQNVSVWDNGGMLAYQFRVPALEANVIGNDRVSSLLTLLMAYGVRIADSAFIAGFRAFCKNQMGQFAMLAGDNRVRHKGDVTGKYADILQGRIAELSTELPARFEVMRRMTTTPIAGRALAEYFGESIGASKQEVDQSWVMPPDDLRGTASKIPEILECYQADDCGAPGTVWQAYNAVTRYGTHKSGRNAANRQRTMLMGTGADMATRAYEAGRLLSA